MKFFVYDVRRPGPAAQVAEEIGRIAAATAGYDHEEEMMFFAVVPDTVLADILATVDRRYVKVGVQGARLDEQDPAAGMTLAALEELSADMVLVEGDSPPQKHNAILQQGFKTMVCVGEGGEKTLEEQIQGNFGAIPQDAFYRTGVIYRPSAGQGGSPAAPLGAIRAALAKAQPAAPEPLPVFYGGSAAPAKALEYLNAGLADGLYARDDSWTPADFIDVIQKAMG